MIYRFIAILIGLTAATFTAAAQDNGDNSEPVLDFEPKLMGKPFINNYPGKGQQFYKSWMPGELLTSDGATVTNKILVYNTLKDELIWMRASDQLQVTINKESIAGFKLFGANNNPVAEFKLKYLTAKAPDDSIGVYLEVLTEGEISLYAQRKVIVSQNTGEFWNRDQYYLHKDGKFYSLALRRKHLYELMGDNIDEIKALVRANSLSLRKEQGMIKAIQLFNAGR